MYLKAVNYKGMWLAPGSHAYKLYEGAGLVNFKSI